MSNRFVIENWMLNFCIVVLQLRHRYSSNNIYIDQMQLTSSRQIENKKIDVANCFL